MPGRVSTPARPINEVAALGCVDSSRSRSLGMIAITRIRAALRKRAETAPRESLAPLYPLRPPHVGS
jgi:hypothetical protein